MGKWNGLPHEQQYLCGAHARSTGQPCKRFAGKNGRCKLHGGRSTGAKKPNVTHGLYTKEALEFRRQYAELLRESRALLTEYELSCKANDNEYKGYTNPA